MQIHPFKSRRRIGGYQAAGDREPVLLLAEDHFALAHQLVVEPEAVFIGRGFAAGAWRSAEEADPGGRLKNVRRERAAVHVKLDTQVSRVGNPGNLVAGIQDHGLRNQSNQHRAFCHFFLRFIRMAASGRLLLEEATRSDNSTFCRAISRYVALPEPYETEKRGGFTTQLSFRTS